MKLKYTKLPTFKHMIVNNPNFIPIKQTSNININNTSCIVIWHNLKKNKLYYLIQKRSNSMPSGADKLAIPGGMLEKHDKYIQYGAIRELLEETQLSLRTHNNMSHETIEILSKCLFPLSQEGTNITFFIIIASKKMPEWIGPLSHSIYPFKKSIHEVDMIDHTWNKNIKYGHTFMSSSEIIKKQHFFWKYSIHQLFKLIKVLNS